jgi:hypothetical protein
MFGLTQREQRWAAEQRAVELLTEITCTALKAQAEVEMARVQGETSDVKALREEVAELRKMLATRFVSQQGE